jgi:transposase
MRRSEIEWREEDTEVELGHLYRMETRRELRPRWQALWLLRRGKSRAEVCDVVGVNPRTLRDWIAWYRDGGTATVRRHRIGGHGSLPKLAQEQCAEIVERAGEGEFRTIEQVRIWVIETWGIYYTYWGMRTVLDRLHIHPRVPRPLAAKADLELQESWKKGGSHKLSWQKG